MPWWAAAGFGVAAAGGLASYNASQQQALAQAAWQRYQNGMTKIAAAQNQNAITTNTTEAIQASAEEAVNNQEAGMQASAAARVAAAAAGVSGGSVSATMFSVERSKAEVEYQRQEELRRSFLSFDASRRSVELGGKLQEDHSYIPRPSGAALLLGIAGAGIKAFGPKD